MHEILKKLKGDIELLSKMKEVVDKKQCKLTSMCLSGSHLYGFESEDSDIDIRGMFKVDTNKILGLSTPKNVIELQLGNKDIVLFELKKEIRLALKGNCNSLEHWNAKQIYCTKEYLKLKRLINNAWGKDGIYHSYRGMAEQNYKKFILQGRNTTKKYLYVFRALMAGIHALQTGQIQPNIDKLNRYFKLPEVKMLIKCKKENKEKDMIPKEIDSGELDKKIEELRTRAEEAYIKSKIPEKPSEEDVKKIEETLIGIRYEYKYG